MNNLEYANHFLTELCLNFFRNGDVSLIHGYVYAVLALAYLRRVLGIEGLDHVIEDHQKVLESKHDYLLMIVPENEALFNHLSRLNEDIELLHHEKGERNMLLFIKDYPSLRLVETEID